MIDEKADQLRVLPYGGVMERGHADAVAGVQNLRRFLDERLDCLDIAFAERIEDFLGLRRSGGNRRRAIIEINVLIPGFLRTKADQVQQRAFRADEFPMLLAISCQLTAKIDPIYIIR